MVFDELKNIPDANGVFMNNHGVVIGGTQVDDVATTLHTLIFKLKAKSTVSEP